MSAANSCPTVAQVRKKSHLLKRSIWSRKSDEMFDCRRWKLLLSEFHIFAVCLFLPPTLQPRRIRRLLRRRSSSRNTSDRFVFLWIKSRSTFPKSCISLHWRCLFYRSEKESCEPWHARYAWSKAARCAGLFRLCFAMSDPATLHSGNASAVRKKGTNGKDSTGGRAARRLLPNMVRLKFLNTCLDL